MARNKEVTSAKKGLYRSPLRVQILLFRVIALHSAFRYNSGSRLASLE